MEKEIHCFNHPLVSPGHCRPLLPTTAHFRPQKVSIISATLSMKRIFKSVKMQPANELANKWLSLVCKFNLHLANWFSPSPDPGYVLTPLSIARCCCCFAVNQNCSYATHCCFAKLNEMISSEFFSIHPPTQRLPTGGGLTISRDRLHCCGKLVKFTYHWLLLFMYQQPSSWFSQWWL